MRSKFTSYYLPSSSKRFQRYFKTTGYVLNWLRVATVDIIIGFSQYMTDGCLKHKTKAKNIKQRKRQWERTWEKKKEKNKSFFFFFCQIIMSTHSMPVSVPDIKVGRWCKPSLPRKAKKQKTSPYYRNANKEYFFKNVILPTIDISLHRIKSAKC